LPSPDQLQSRLARAGENGVTQAKLVETITYLVLYARRPNTVTAISVAREVFQQKRCLSEGIIGTSAK
jgi:4-carboxymuconolactone decarboxylase